MVSSERVLASRCARTSWQSEDLASYRVNLENSGVLLGFGTLGPNIVRAVTGQRWSGLGTKHQ
jgi:hypothetical protein